MKKALPFQLSKDRSFFESLGDGTVPKDIKIWNDAQTLGSIDSKEWTASFNYFGVLQNMYEKARISFYPFLCVVDPKFSLNNVDMIKDEELIGYTPSVKPAHRKTKKLYMYIQQKLKVTKTTRTRLVYGHLPPYKKINMYLETLNSNIEEFFEYVQIQYPDTYLDDYIFEEIESTVNSKTIKTDFLFKDLIKCSKCGNVFVGKKEGKGVRYTCVKNRTDNSNRCHSYKIKEPLLIEMFESETNAKFNKELLFEMVDKIEVVGNDKAIIHYK